MTRRHLLAMAATAATALRAQTAARSPLGVVQYSFNTARKPVDTLGFLDYCHSLGAAGVQFALTKTDSDYLRQIRERVEKTGLYYEAITSMPKGDGEQFRRQLSAAKDAGARCIRVACLSGRRYETFHSLEDWNAFVAVSKKAIDQAAREAESVKMPVAMENHKDWTLAELLPVIRQYHSDTFGSCVDTGNNISLLDDPMELIEALAPYALTTHIKDMAVEAAPNGFLLSEVPLGQGILDIKRIVKTFRQAKPSIHFNLEMISRDPLVIPCLTDGYWTTFPDRNGRYLARTLALVQEKGRKLPRMSSLPPDEQKAVEERNVLECLRYASENFG